MTKPLTQKELADKLRVDVRTVYNWRKTGKVDAMKVGGVVRITRVNADLQRRSTGSTSST
jgi:excisionase family DNA binding protein